MVDAAVSDLLTDSLFQAAQLIARFPWLAGSSGYPDSVSYLQDDEDRQEPVTVVSVTTAHPVSATLVPYAIRHSAPRSPAYDRRITQTSGPKR